jgi:hypothetical protein
MSTPFNDGGSAFPRPGMSANWAEGQFAQTGMTLRDYFAGQALAGMLANKRVYDFTELQVVGDCYYYADIMLRRRVLRDNPYRQSGSATTAAPNNLPHA